MMRTRGHVVLGLVLVVAGYSLLLGALVEENEHCAATFRASQAAIDAPSLRAAGSERAMARAAAAGATAAAGASQAMGAIPAAVGLRPEIAPVSALDGGREAVDSGAQPASAIEAGAGTQSPGATGADAAATIEPGEPLLFRFLPGGAAMSQTELPRLLAAAKALAKDPAAHVTIEAFGDLPGTDPLQAKIATHRAKAAQYIVQKAGVSDKRIAVTTPVMDDPAKCAHAVRITTDVPLPELEGP